VRAAFRAADRRFAGLLAELAAELPELRRPLGPVPHALSGPVARRMAEACAPHRDVFVTPMAAVAGAVAEAVLEAMVAAGGLERAYVNDGGDIALFLAPGASLRVGVVRSLALGAPEGGILVRHDDPVRGIATSGRHGRSLSLGVADSVTALARRAADADVAATLIANAVDLPGHPAIARAPARDIDPDSDLGGLPVVAGVGPLSPEEAEAALDRGAAAARSMLERGLVAGALLSLGGRWRAVGAACQPSAAADTPLRASPPPDAMRTGTRPDRPRRPAPGGREPGKPDGATDRRHNA
jgi:ApbE superfamily uncharacterized protein (UPF0280 family)